MTQNNKIFLLKNVIFSFLYDIRIFISTGLKIRAGANGYEAYRTIRLYPGYLQCGGAMVGIESLAKVYCQGHGLDIGAGSWPFERARPVENLPDEDAYKINESSSSQDFIFSSHLLEHLDDPQKALSEWYRVLKPGGTLFLYLPHPACAMWQPQHLKHHKWMPSPLDLKEMLDQLDKFKVVDMTYFPDGMLSYFVVAQCKK